MQISCSISDALDALTYQEALSIPFLDSTKGETDDLLSWIESIPFTPLKRVVAGGKVTQTIDRVDVVGPPWTGIGAEMFKIKEMIERFFAEVDPYLFEENLNFNEFSVQRYPVGGGISPHVDGKKFQNLIALIVLDGHGELYTCKDRSGTGSKQVSCLPGQLVLLPARGYMERNDTPFHYLTHVTSTRYVLGLRQNTLLAS